MAELKNLGIVKEIIQEPEISTLGLEINVSSDGEYNRKEFVRINFSKKESDKRDLIELAARLYDSVRFHKLIESQSKESTLGYDCKEIGNISIVFNL